MPSTTHDPAEAGHPRLILAHDGTLMVDDDGVPERPTVEFPLEQTVTHLGGGDDDDIVLRGLASHQAVIVHDHHDEFVFHQESQAIPTRINGQLIGRHALRTGDRLEMGEWTLSFMRDEAADHGRPHGGRQGGEGSIQRSQPPRSATTAAEDPGVQDLETSPSMDSVASAPTDQLP